MPEATATKQPTPGEGPAGRVLVIDDSPPIEWLVRAWLKKERFEVHGARDGEEGLRRAADVKPDLILLDLDMPGMDGFECCRRLKARPETADIAVVFLTASGEACDKARGLDLGALDYIAKPFQAEEFRARVRSALRIKRTVDQLTNKAQVDPLTGLRNRGYLDERLAELRSKARRGGEAFSVLMCDVDHFKNVNDTYGHAVGDDVLRGIAAVIRETCREEDVVCRYGGEELCVVAPGVGLYGAATLGGRLRAAVAGLMFDTPQGTLRVTMSVGVAASGQRSRSGVSAGSIGGDPLARADHMLYRAKEGGRDRVEVDGPACLAEAA